jgi:hypothetical protein
VVSVEAATARELESFGPKVAESALAASALVLARQMDRRVSWAVAKELRETLAALKASAPVKEEEDEIERARRRRSERLAGQSASGASSPS